METKVKVKFRKIPWLFKPGSRREKCHECGRRAWPRSMIMKVEKPEGGIETSEVFAVFCFNCSTGDVLDKHMARLCEEFGCEYKGWGCEW